MAWTRARLYEALKTILARITRRDASDILAKTTLAGDLRFRDAVALRALAARLEREFLALGLTLEIDRNAISGVDTVFTLAGLLEKSQREAAAPRGRGLAAAPTDTARKSSRGARPAPAGTGRRAPRRQRSTRTPRKPRSTTKAPRPARDQRRDDDEKPPSNGRKPSLPGILLLIAAATATSEALAQDPVRLPTPPTATTGATATPDDPEVERVTRRLVLRDHLSAELLALLDANADGEVSEAELGHLAAVVEKLRVEGPYVADVTAIRERYRDSGTEVALEIERRFPATPPKPADLGFLGLRLRRERAEVAIGESETSRLQAFKRAKGALFSWSRDYHDDADLWQARGVLYRPIQLTSGALRGVFVPSIAFDRVSNDGDRPREVDQLTFRAGIDLEVDGIVFDLHSFTADMAYGTDFDFRSDVLAAEFGWEPIWLDAGVGVARPILGGAFEYRLAFGVRGEIGSVLDAGTKTTLDENDDFARAGGFLELELWPMGSAFLERLKLHASLEMLAGFAGQEGGTSLFEVGLAWDLDAKGHFGLEAGYRKGDAGLAKDDVDILSIALSLKF